MHKKTWGVICLVGPFLLLIVTLAAYAIVTFALSASGSDSLVAGQIVGMILGFVGLVSMVALVPCFIIGIVLLVKK